MSSPPADVSSPPTDMASCTIAFRDVRTGTIGDSGAMAITIPRPTAVAGDLLLAGIHLGWGNNGRQPIYTAPAGWTLVRRTDSGDDASLLVYYRYAIAGDPASFTWTSDDKVAGVGWIAAYSGVHATQPIDVEAGSVDTGPGPVYTTPSITTTGPKRLVVASFSADSSSGSTTWMAQGAYTLRAGLNNSANRSGMSEELAVPTPATQVAQGRVSTAQFDSIQHILALRPCP
jgi:hypothetical protein